MKASVASNLAVISFHLLIIGFSSISVYVNASRNHIVGGDRGWRFPSKSSYNIWDLHRSFAAGDTLCLYNELRQSMSSGSDKIRLKKRINYFICSLPGHCAAGMKMKVQVKKKKSH
ncbi:hypothetical protein MKW98_023488 [Papaver atlanticum]|uniref:Phytocyanin domain-containing protein n=1 Tax=Papaver atlanticum TaxID=357466 RepID=A0AAD4SYW5_9MAGN|nr:hypothetical protein MKW98_023488 [Papaver atlanticum]